MDIFKIIIKIIIICIIEISIVSSIVYTVFDIVMKLKKKYRTKVIKNHPINYTHYNSNRNYDSDDGIDSWGIGDCAIRAVSVIEKITWDDSLDLFCESSKETGIPPIDYDNVVYLINFLGYNEYDIDLKKYKFFYKNINDISKMPEMKGKKALILSMITTFDGVCHMTAMIDNKYYDAFDSGRMLVYKVFVKDN
jgi:hypothetical protein